MPQGRESLIRGRALPAQAQRFSDEPKSLASSTTKTCGRSAWSSRTTIARSVLVPR